MNAASAPSGVVRASSAHADGNVLLSNHLHHVHEPEPLDPFGGIAELDGPRQIVSRNPASSRAPRRVVASTAVPEPLLSGAAELVRAPAASVAD